MLPPAARRAKTEPPPPAGTGWGPAPGRVSGTEDLTSVRLRPSPSSAVDVEPPGSAQTPATLGEETDRPRVSRLGIVLGGVAVGVALVILGWSLWRPVTNFGTLPATTPTPVASAPTPAAASTDPTTQAHNPNLAPRGLTVALSGNTVTATWQKPIDEPEAYGWGLTSNPRDQPVIEHTNLPTERTAQKVIDPSWAQVCVTVVGVRDREFGGDRACATR